MTDIQTKKLQDVRSQMSEMFEEYLLICRPDRHQMLVSSSDSTWALGAAKRYVTLVDCEDRITQ